MKKRLVTITAIVGLVSMFGTVSLVSALDKGKEKFTINAQEQHPDFVKSHPDAIKEKDKKKVKDFEHYKHQEEFVKGKQAHALFKYDDDWTCGACHHKTKKGDQPTACLKCKDLNKMLEKTSKNGKKKFENIYHNNCRDACHKKNDKKSAKCNFCHG